MSFLIPSFNLAGKRGLILGLANEHSIAWGCTRLFHALGARVVASCLNEKARSYVEPLTQSLEVKLLIHIRAPPRKPANGPKVALR